MAPEIQREVDYHGTSVDLYSCAIILFIMVTRHPPFTRATAKDPFFKLIAANNAEKFWKTHCATKPGGRAFFSEEFIDLLTTMFQYNPKLRLSLPEIMSHSWMEGPVPTHEEIYAEFA